MICRKKECFADRERMERRKILKVKKILKYVIKPNRMRWMIFE